jgi:hypothetical protein
LMQHCRPDEVEYVFNLFFGHLVVCARVCIIFAGVCVVRALFGRFVCREAEGRHRLGRPRSGGESVALGEAGIVVEECVRMHEISIEHRRGRGERKATYLSRVTSEVLMVSALPKQSMDHEQSPAPPTQRQWVTAVEDHVAYKQWESTYQFTSFAQRHGCRPM